MLVAVLHVDKHVQSQRKVLAAAGRYLWSQAVSHTVSCKCSLAVGLHDKQVFSGIRYLSWDSNQNLMIFNPLAK